MTSKAIQCLKRIDYFIQKKGTGTPQQLAARLGVTERCLYKYLNVMKECGAPIKFSNSRQSYYYDEDGHFNISFRFKKSVYKIPHVQ